MSVVAANNDCTTFSAIERRSFGTGEARQLRREGGVVPGVIYTRIDGGAPKVSGIAINARELRKEYLKKHIVGRLFNIQIEGGKKPVLAVLYDFSMHSVSGSFEHVEFYEVPSNGLMLAKIPIVFVNHDISLPAKRGAFLNVLHRTLTIECDPKNYKESVRVDLKDAALGQAYRVSDLDLPSGSVVRNCHTNTLVARFIGKKAGAAAVAETSADSAATSTAAANKDAKPNAKK